MLTGIAASTLIGLELPSHMSFNSEVPNGFGRSIERSTACKERCRTTLRGSVLPSLVHTVSTRTSVSVGDVDACSKRRSLSVCTVAAKRETSWRHEIW